MRGLAGGVACRCRGRGALNEALLSGNRWTFVNVALPALATLWERTLGTARQVKGAVCGAVHAVRADDAEPGGAFDRGAGTEADRVAVPTVKISLQAMMLEYGGGEGAGGSTQYERLDPLTVSLGHPDALDRGAVGEERR